MKRQPHFCPAQVTRILAAVEQHCGAELRAAAGAAPQAPLQYRCTVGGGGGGGRPALKFRAGDPALAEGQTVKGLGLRDQSVLYVSAGAV